MQFGIERGVDAFVRTPLPLQPMGRRGAVTPSKFSTYGNTMICGKTVENELTANMKQKILVRNRIERAPLLVMKNSAASREIAGVR